MNKIIQKNQSGFTLIEIMIAIVVLSIGLLAVAAMQIAAVKGNSYANELTEAATIAQNIMEELMIISDYQNEKAGTVSAVANSINFINNNINPADGLDLTNGSHPISSTVLTVVGATNRSYDIKWNISDDTPPPDTKLKTIIITVTWNHGGQTRTVLLNSLKADI